MRAIIATLAVAILTFGMTAAQQPAAPKDAQRRHRYDAGRLEGATRRRGREAGLGERRVRAGLVDHHDWARGGSSISPG